jgi:general secretion pathway protein D
MAAMIYRIRLVPLLAALLLLAPMMKGQEVVAPVGIAPAGDAAEMIDRISLRDDTLAQVLNLLERLTGRAVIRPQALPSPTFTFDSQGPLTREELILAIESLLSINGIGVAPLGDKFVKVVPIANIRTEAPELVVRSLIGEPPSGKVVSRLFRLTYLDSATFQTQIQPFLSPGFGTIIPFQNSNAVIVTDTISNLQRLEYVVSEVDKPSRLNIETKFYTLLYATASEIGAQINTLIESARTGFGTPQATPNRSQDPQAPAEAPVGPPTPGGDEGVVPIQVVLGGNTSINWDDRTNQLIVITDPTNLPFFDNIIEKLDIAADPPTRIDVIPLQHADAVEVASLLSQLVSGETKQEGLDADAVSGVDRATPERRTFGGGPEVDRVSTPASASRSAVLDAVANQIEGWESQFSDFMTIVADERSNALIVSGTITDIDLISKIISEIDIVLAQVRIEVVIAQVTLSENDTRGIDSFNLSYDSQLGQITELATAVGTTTIGATLIEGTSDYLIDAVITAAGGDSDIKLLSAPTIVTTHNKEATIIVAESRPIITSSQTSLSIGDSTRSTFQFQDIGITLKVKPLIGPNDVIQMEIDQTVDDVVDNVTIDGNDQPVIGRRQATSFVSVKSSEMIVLGGLRRTRVSRTKSRMFILGQIPIIAPLFTQYNDEDEDQELVVFIRPVVIRNTDEAFVDAQQRLTETKDPEKIQNFMGNRSEVVEDESNESDEVPEKPEEAKKMPTPRFHKK